MKHKIILGFAFLLVLFWLWPNLIHEPLHLLALKLQGLDGTITFDWHFPAQPYIEKHGQVQSVIGGLTYLLLPSIFSGILLMVLFLKRPSGNLFTSIMLPAYLITDLIINIVHYPSPTSDFHFLSAFPQWSSVIIALPLILLAGITILKNTECFVQVHE